MNEIVRFDRDGIAIEFTKLGDAWGITVPEAAPKLGYERPDNLARLIQRNIRRFKPTEVRPVKVTGRDGKPRPSYVLSPYGFLRACLLGRTAVSQKFHDLVVYEAIPALYGQRALATQDARIDRLERLLGDALRIVEVPEQYDDALAVVRVVDKLFRIATDRDAMGESPWRDVAGYGLLGAARVEAERAGGQP